MKQYLNISMTVLLGMFLLSACKKEATEKEEEPGTIKISLTKAADAGGDWTLYLDAASADRPEIWADINNNRVKDNGESIANFGTGNANRFSPGSSKTIGLYGRVTIFHCHDNELTALDVSKSTALVELYCLGNRLTTLDLSKNTALQKLSCFGNKLTTLDLSGNTNIRSVQLYGNQISAANMTQLINSLPARQAADDARLYVRQASDNNSLPTATDIATAKTKNWKLYAVEGNDWKAL
ncbi:MAG TPA: hypothetical protein PLR74_11810 [Agriterribacter sp.]|nr:hypothetical protein [Niabella sp.]HRQ51217.1 hypothetical protein [Agriterribacter sp.]